jgi:hypothetical protein
VDPLNLRSPTPGSGNRTWLLSKLSKNWDEIARRARFSFALWRGLIYHYFLVKNPERGLFHDEK